MNPFKSLKVTPTCGNDTVVLRGTCVLSSVMSEFVRDIIEVYAIRGDSLLEVELPIFVILGYYFIYACICMEIYDNMCIF